MDYFLIFIVVCVAVLLVFMVIILAKGARGRADIRAQLLGFAQNKAWTVDPIPKDSSPYHLQLYNSWGKGGYVRFLAHKDVDGIRHELVYSSRTIWEYIVGLDAMIPRDAHCVFFSTTSLAKVDGSFHLFPKLPSNQGRVFYKKIPTERVVKNYDPAVYSRPPDFYKIYITDDFMKWYDQLDDRPFIEYSHDALSVGGYKRGDFASLEALNNRYQQFQEVLKQFQSIARSAGA